MKPMNRRTFLKGAGLSGALITTVACQSLIDKIPAVQQQKEFEQGTGDAHTQVITRLIVDLVVLQLANEGTPAAGEDVYAMIAVAREAVQNGADPSSPSFWQEIGGSAGLPLLWA